MMFINFRDSEPPPSDWIVRAEELTRNLSEIEDERDRQEFIVKNKQHWRELVEWLRAKSYGKCWYTEARSYANHEPVDHFRPKGRVTYKFRDGSKPEGYWWLAFEWKNYRYSGGVPNTHKRDKFDLHPDSKVHCHGENCIDDELPYLLDPTDANDPGMLTFDCDGLACPAFSKRDGETVKEKWNRERAEYTIDELNLNGHQPLPEGRLRVWNKVRRRWSHLIQELRNLPDNCLPSSANKQNVNHAFISLARLLRSDEEFSMVALRCLQQIATVEDAKSGSTSAMMLLSNLQRAAAAR